MSDLQNKIDAEFADRKSDLIITQQQIQEFSAKLQQAQEMALQIAGAIKQLQVIGAKDPVVPPVTELEHTPDTPSSTEHEQVENAV